MKILGFIPARGGSKGIPRKNLTPLNGIPLIRYTLEAAQKSRRLSEVFVSTEDGKIMDFCRSKGLDTPYVRPKALAEDQTAMIDTVLHALEWMEERTKLPDILVLLQPTSPLRSHGDIDDAVDRFLASKADTLTSVHKVDEHPFECLKIGNHGWRFLAKPRKKVTRRQDFGEDFYFVNGAIYVANVGFLREKKTFLVEGETGIYIMPKSRGIDIDELHDLQLAESYLSPRSR